MGASSFSLLLFAPMIIAGLLAAVIGGLSAWNHPLAIEQRRVVEAAERAGIRSFLSGAPWVLTAWCFPTLLGLLVSHRRGVSLGLTLGVCLAGLFVVVLVAIFGGRLGVRYACRAQGERVRDAILGHAARYSLLQTISLEASSGLLVTASYFLAEGSVGPEQASILSALAAASYAFPAAVLAERGARMAAMSSELLPAQERAHSGSLADFVSQTFGRSWMVSGTLGSASALGHALLLSITSQLMAELPEMSRLYPQLLRGAALLALTFAALSLRKDSHEGPTSPIRRSLALALILLLSSTWLIRGPWLSTQLLPVVPASTSLLFLGAMLLLITPAMARSRRKDDSQGPGFSQRMGPALAHAAISYLLIFVYELSLRYSPQGSTMPPGLPTVLLLGSLLGILPLLSWLDALGDLLSASRTVSHLLGPRAPSVPLKEDTSLDSWIDLPRQEVRGVLSACLLWVGFLAVGHFSTGELNHRAAIAGLGALTILSLVAVTAQKTSAPRGALAMGSKDREKGNLAPAFSEALETVALELGRPPLLTLSALCLLPVLVVLLSTLLHGAWSTFLLMPTLVGIWVTAQLILIAFSQQEDPTLRALARLGVAVGLALLTLLPVLPSLGT